MSEQSHLHARQEGIIYEVIGEEVVLISLESGAYYSLQGSAAVVFALLESGCARSQLSSKLSDLYGESVNSRVDIEEFVERMLSETLMVSCEKANCTGFDEQTISSLVSKPFAAPKLEKYEDMQDLFLLDPVHPISTSTQSSSSENSEG